MYTAAFRSRKLAATDLVNLYLDCAPSAGEFSPRIEGSAIGGFGLLNCHFEFFWG